MLFLPGRDQVFDVSGAARGDEPGRRKDSDILIAKTHARVRGKIINPTFSGFGSAR
jgi:hypothetical protein